MKYLLGIDVGSSSVKCSLVQINNGACVGSAHSPATEMLIASPENGFAEQDPNMWWEEFKHALNKVKQQVSFAKDEIAAIGISYQMHGLVVVDKNGEPLRPSIIWCDSRAVEIGNNAFSELGESFCLSHYMNSPGNLTASKLKWVKEHQPELYSKIHKIMLPGDYIAYKLSGEMKTTISGLSEGIMWDAKENRLATDLLKQYGIEEELICDIAPQFGIQSVLHTEAAEQLGINAGVPITYRAGDQPNNAFSLNVLEPGEIAATAGTSGVVYGVIDEPAYDKASRVNSFVHVNHTELHKRYGVLLCINGTGILNSWMQKNVFTGLSYPEINALAASAPVGADGLMCFPFGNGAERVLCNADPGSTLKGLHFNRHGRNHMARAVQEGIVNALYYGMEIMVNMGMPIKTVRAGYANMFLSDLFAEAFANTSGATIELFNTDGAQGAARAAGLGAGIFKSKQECFTGLEVLKTIEPSGILSTQYKDAYLHWKSNL